MNSSSYKTRENAMNSSAYKTRESAMKSFSTEGEPVGADDDGAARDTATRDARDGADDGATTTRMVFWDSPRRADEDARRRARAVRRRGHQPTRDGDDARARVVARRARARDDGEGDGRRRRRDVGSGRRRARGARGDGGSGERGGIEAPAPARGRADEGVRGRGRQGERGRDREGDDSNNCGAKTRR